MIHIQAHTAARPSVCFGHPAAAHWYGRLAIAAAHLACAYGPAGGPPAHPPADSPLPKRLLSAYFTRLIQQIDPSGPPISRPRQLAQLAAGRQMALMRIQMGISSAQVARHTGIDPAALLLIEAGLADPAELRPARWRRLRALLDRMLKRSARAARGPGAALRRLVVRFR